MNEEYISQLEHANESLKNKVEELESRLTWEEKTKDLRALAVEYKKMDKEVFTVNKDRLVNSILTLDSNTIMDMWSNGFRITTGIDRVDYCGQLFTPTRHSIYIVGPWSAGKISYDTNKYFAVSLSVTRSFFYPLVSDKCSLDIQHNRVCDFSGAIAESVHCVDRNIQKDILELIKRVNICKYMMNGKLLSQDCYVKIDTFKNPWTDIPEFRR
jgi:hypothetical protein